MTRYRATVCNLTKNFDNFCNFYLKLFQAFEASSEAPVKSVTSKIICSLHNVSKADFDGLMSQLTKKLAEIIVIL